HEPAIEIANPRGLLSSRVSLRVARAFAARPCGNGRSAVRYRTAGGLTIEWAPRKVRDVMPFVDRLWIWRAVCCSHASDGHARRNGEPERGRTNARQAGDGRRVPRAILREPCGCDVGSRPAVVPHRARGAV